jgi:hypothetical protein
MAVSIRREAKGAPDGRDDLLSGRRGLTTEKTANYRENFSVKRFLNIAAESNK